jgi:transposase InsO family protein
LVTFYLLFGMEVATRRVDSAGCTPSPHELWMKQMARNLTDPFDGFLLGRRYLVMDRDAKFSAGFRRILPREGVEPVRLPPRSPNLSPHIGRFMKSIQEECLLKMIFFGETALRQAVASYLAHYHRERNHQGSGNRLIESGDEVGQARGDIQCHGRLGGLLRYYHRAAA